MHRHNKLKKNITIVVSLIVCFGMLWYIYYQSRNFISGPEIEIISPKNGDILTNALTTIEGTAERIARLELNGKQIFVDENNHFSEELLLLDGYNIITLRASDKFKRNTQTEIEVTLRENNPIKIENIIINKDDNGNEEKSELQE